MLNLSQTVVDNLSPEGRLAVAGHALDAANATIHDLAEQLVGAKVLLRAANAALRCSQAHVDQLMAQVKEQALVIASLRGALACETRLAQRQATALQQIHQETGRAEAHARGHDQMVDLLAEDRMWNAMLGTWAGEVDCHIRQGGECIIAAIRRIRSETGLGTLVCRTLAERRAEYL